MADKKYGRLFTETEVRSLINTALYTGKRFDDLADSIPYTFPPDEPTFVLRAQDALAIPTISDYARHCLDGGASPQHIERIMEAYNEFLEWRAEERKQKVPD